MEICEKSKCTGCHACYNVCPKGCIDFEFDEYGFCFPVVDERECMECNLCVRSCPANNESVFSEPEEVYAAWNTNTPERKASASGGVAMAMYEEIVSAGGVVYGVCMEEKFWLRFSRADKREDLSKFQGSKYAQADVGDVFKSVKADLENGREVLFIGTPCQVDGLKFFLKKMYENLYVVDLICHGVPSIKYLTEHIDGISKKYDLKPKRVGFREEDDYKFILYGDESADKIYEKTAFCDEYMLGFLKSLFNRDSCYNCKYANTKRVSDVTLGDFGGIGKKYKFDHYKGAVYLVLVNTDKGRDLMNLCKESLFMEPRTLDEALMGNEQLNYPCKKHVNHEMFREIYREKGFDIAVGHSLEKELKKGPIYYRKKLLKKRIKKLLAIFIKKYRGI